MDLSFDGENNFALPEPAGKLDFTEDEDRRNDGQCAGSAFDQQCGDEYDKESEQDISMNADESESSDIEDSSGNVEPIEFSKPLVNQNLMLNRKAGPSKNAFARPANGLQEPVTPALIKRKQFKQWFNSPTDNCLSPCTQKIFKQKKPT